MPYIIEKTFNSEIFTKVGNPTITDDGIASGFSGTGGNPSAAILVNYSLNSNNKVTIKSTQKALNLDTSNPQTIWSMGYGSNTRLEIFAQGVAFREGNTQRVWMSASSILGRFFIDGDIIYSTVELNGNTVTVTIKCNNNTVTSSYTGMAAWSTNFLSLGFRYSDLFSWHGSIDLKQFKITVDGKVVLNGTTSKEVYVLPSIQELKDYYSNTLIVQYHDKPKAKQTIEMLVYLVFSEMLLFQVQNAFNWKTAVGKQLDVIGQWVGVSRTFNINLLTESKLAYPQYDRLDPDTTSALQGGYSDYETFGTLQGGQLRYSDIQTTTNNLNDDNYRIIIGLKIIFNSINHTAKAIDDAIWEYFNHEVYTVWTDNTLTYYYPSNLAQVMLFADYKGVLPAPTGVTVQLTEI